MTLLRRPLEQLRLFELVIALPRETHFALPAQVMLQQLRSVTAITALFRKPVVIQGMPGKRPTFRAGVPRPLSLIDQGGTLMKREKSAQRRKSNSLDHGVTNGMSRRSFVKSAATIASVAAAIPLEPFFGGKESVVEAAGANGNDSPNSNAANRMNDCFNYRKNMALANKVNMGPQAGNGDAATFTDFSCSYSKGLLHDNLGVPNSAALLSLSNAFASGNPAQFANIIVGP